MKQIQKIVVIFDGIHNSVFQSQVVAPLKKSSQPITIISFERTVPKQKEIEKIIPNSFNFIFLKRFPFMGIWSLRYCIWQLKNELKAYDDYELVARGPQAGYVSLNSVDKKCRMLIIQARGLLAEEYLFLQKHKKKENKLLTKIRYLLFSRLEYYTYKKQPRSFNYCIEAVSPALKSYLAHCFNTDHTRITIATNDIPTPIPDEDRFTFRAAKRMELGIPDDTIVYCYNGSAKPWQCPKEMLQFFEKKLQENPLSRLLIISQDKALFEELVQKNKLTAYATIISSNQEEVAQYLCAANYGILLRDRHLINWISRPTKALEYKAAGLEIIHNHSVEYIC